MYFDFEDRHPETPTLDTAMSRREALVLSVAVHLLLLVFLFFAPDLAWVQALNEQSAEAVAARVARLEAERQQQQQAPRFVFVQPRIDTPAPAPPARADLSDMDRQARTVERPAAPTNSLPFARGNSSERVEATPEMRARGQGPRPEPAAPGEGAAAGERADAARASNTNGPGFEVPGRAETRANQTGRPGVGGGNLGDALRNLQQYVQNQSFDNPGGGDSAFGPAIQFDTKGVEFGPWVRRFIAQVKRNWFIPYAAMSMHGHVVLTFNVHRDGRITDLRVVKPAGVQAFDNAAFNALAASNPTQALPREYPDDRAFFTVTFYYNEAVPSQ
jgi:TonB family protein